MKHRTVTLKEANEACVAARQLAEMFETSKLKQLYRDAQALVREIEWGLLR